MNQTGDILSGLNARQAEAVTSTEGRIRVVAGAGTGKTKALTHRYSYLVNVLGIDPANILCLTFTNKAASEMRQRISKMVHSGDYNDFVCT
ncbi:MAG: ATP-dependent helicase, partial [Bacteroidales bacterium]|nr:ATP-dependent helicase [Candidatus Cryptobacteroides faecihippi]